MKKVKLAFIAAVAVLCFACRGKTEADFSLVPVEGANGEYQYIDIPQKGKIVINPQFGRAHLFRDGLALVKTSGKDGKWGYIDKKGKYIIAPTYDYAQDFSNGVAWVQMENQTPMLIDKKGKMVLQIDSLIGAMPFNKGIAGIGVYSRGQELTMFIDKKGKSVITTIPGEEIIPVIIDGMYVFQDKASEKWGYKNKSGEIVINAQYEEVNPFLDGMAAVMSGKKWGAIDKKGNIVINPQYDSLQNDGKGLFFAKVGKKFGWVNKNNEITINPQFDVTFGFRKSKLAPVQMGSKWGYIDIGGQIVINPQFKLAMPFNGDYAMVMNDDKKIGFIDKAGTYVVAPLYDMSSYDISEYIVATEQNLYGISVQGGKEFGPYDRLKEKKEEERERAIAAASDSFTDSRDNKKYKTIKIGTQTWMAENLNYQGDGYLGLCYGDKPREQIRKPENCDKYGRLYDWSEAMGLDREFNWKKLGNDENIQGVCPSGWHLPSKEEWNTLITAVGGSYVAGAKLKARSGWNNNSNGTDEFGFSALPSGFGDGDGRFHNIGDDVGLWSATEYSGSYAYRWTMDNRNSADSYHREKSRLMVVRCVKDEAITAKASGEAKKTDNISDKSFTDSRDGIVYKAVTIGNQTWMAQNLSYDAQGSKCYENQESNCLRYGRLYNWFAAVKACPSGWHLPSNSEWDALYRFVDGTNGTESPYKSETAGKFLKAKNGWNDSEGYLGNGTDDYGFAALPGGLGNSSGAFSSVGNYGNWWSSSESDGSRAYNHFKSYKHNNAGWENEAKNKLFSVRCVQD
ncbi:MAG: WG repeat-containing protein [Fibromonadaceae bacterium]|jgi:uncharacterized protein (TIGR02145 family)|nr:WG repeat-containing protein [Fibromonadaceae bacterium]